MKNEAKSYREIGQKFRALAHPARLKLVENLMEQECCVGEIQRCLSLPQPNVSQHLGVLKAAGIIVGRREKNRVCYKISDERIIKTLEIFDLVER